jgi:MscS family membrane protein
LGKFGKASRELASFIVKLIKILIITIGIIALLQDWGINVTGFIASLGLGGLAFALAAKDTAANIFGGIAILTDKIFKTGEWVKIGDVEGIVEDIGMRTTKIRAFDKRLIILPNATIANSAVENFSRRNKRRILMRIGLVYSTPVETIKKIIEDIRSLLLSHPKIAKDESLLIYFDQFEDSSLSIFCYFFTNTAVWKEYLEIREEINLEIKKIVEKRGSSFAFPSNSVYFETPLRINHEKTNEN